MEVGAALEALIGAAKTGDEAAVRQLISEHPGLGNLRLPSGESAVMAALYRGHLRVVEALIEVGTEIDVFAAAATGNVSALSIAATNRETVKAYAFDGWTPLHLSAFFGQLEAAMLLLEAGADLHAKSRNSLRNTPLHAAVAGKHSQIALLFVERGADASAADAGGYTALTIAAENGLREVVDAIENRRR